MFVPSALLTFQHRRVRSFESSSVTLKFEHSRHRRVWLGMEQTESQVAQVRSKERVPSETVQTAVSLGTVAVFGASGRTGVQVLRQLCAQGCCRQVRAIVRDAARLETELATWKQPSTASPVTVQVKAVGDLTQLDVRSLSDLVSDVDAIIWVAGATGGRGGIETPPAALDEATLRRLCDALALQPSTPSSGHRVTFRSPEEMADVLDFGRGRIVADAFTSVDDVVMGGLSSSGLIYDEREALGIFAGTVTTDGGGGFCHVRCDASIVAPAQRFGDVSLLTSEEKGCRVSYWDLSSYDGLALVVRGDGRRYKLNLKTTAEPETVFQQEFSTSGDLPPGTFETHFLPFADFVPVRRGLPLYGSGPVTYAMQLDPSRIRSIGLVYSKVAIGGGPAIDFMPGSFRLACRRISAYRQVPPRLIVLSSAAVTRPYWSPLKRQAYPELAQVPIVKLNPFGVLGHKLAGEDAVRTLVSHRSSLGAPYTIVRAVGLNDGDDPSFPGAATGELRFGQGDLMVGKISRAVLAELIVRLLREREAFCKTFEVKQEPRPMTGTRAAADTEASALGKQLEQLRIDIARALKPAHTQ